MKLDVETFWKLGSTRQLLKDLMLLLEVLLLLFLLKINFSEYMNHGWNALCIPRGQAFLLSALLFSLHMKIPRDKLFCEWLDRTNILWMFVSGMP